MTLTGTNQTKLTERKLQRLIALTKRLGGRAALYTTSQGQFVAPTWIQSYPAIGSYKVVSGTGDTFDVYQIISEDYRSDYHATARGLSMKAAAAVLKANSRRTSSANRLKAVLKASNLWVRPVVPSVSGTTS